jgi:hypothetical protein
MANKEGEPLNKFTPIMIPVVIIIGICSLWVQHQETKQSLDSFRTYFVWVDSNEVSGQLSYVRTGSGKLEVFKLENDPEGTQTGYICTV